MHRYQKAGILLSLGLIGAAGCSDFLSGPGLTENPNSPTVGTMLQQLIAVQANMFVRLEGQLARSAGMYTQQFIGSNNQQLLWGTQYGATESDIPGFMSALYTGAGLLGLRNIQSAAHIAGDSFIEGVAKVWEGYAFGMATSIWGDLPYTEALNPAILTPKLDPQQTVYTEVQKRLDEGITLLKAAPTSGNCDPADLIYCGTTGPRAQQVSRWIAAAYTLKARFYLHLVERQGNAAYTLALAAAQNGIAEAPTTAAQAMNGQAPGDFRSLHGGTLDQDGNIWAEFLLARQDIVAGNVLVSILKARSDPRLNAYFDLNGTGAVAGSDENNVPVGPGASSVLSTAHRALLFRQPYITWAENQLILAEAEYQLNDIPSATINVNNVRLAVGMPALAPVTFNDVMLEKYIAMFQNIDVWSDFKRTCIPLLRPFGAAPEVPGRLPYSVTERTANPNLPLPSAYPAGTTGTSPVRNWNDPTPCPRAP
jgi:starch-binding outer membrane protein, SusD/RagB family